MRRLPLGAPARERQLCAVIGYEPASRSTGRSLQLHLAYGALPDCGLRYAGRVEVPARSARFSRELGRVLRGLRSTAYPPGVQSPLPAEMQWVMPSVLVEVAHSGWSRAGLLVEAELVSVVGRDSRAS